MSKVKGPTMVDVAKEAGVALGTVSKVINGIPVGESYKKKVEAAIEKLHYRVNTYAKGLKASKTNAVAVLVPNLISPFFSKLVNYIGLCLFRRHYRMLVYCTDYDPIIEQEYIHLAEMQDVDGIICLSYNPNLDVDERIPFVSIDRWFSDSITCVSSNNYEGGRLAAKRLVQNGCESLAFFRIGSSLPHEPSKRRDGFLSYCEEHKVPVISEMLVDGQPYSCFETFLQEHIHDGRLAFDGIFCATDSLAYQIINSLRRLGIKVPEQVQIIGFDGCRHFGDLDLTCSTIVQPIEDIAKTCVDAILSEQKMPQALVCLPVRYAYGGTTIDKD